MGYTKAFINLPEIIMRTYMCKYNTEFNQGKKKTQPSIFFSMKQKYILIYIWLYCSVMKFQKACLDATNFWVYASECRYNRHVPLASFLSNILLHLQLPHNSHHRPTPITCQPQHPSIENMRVLKTRINIINK